MKLLKQFAIITGVYAASEIILMFVPVKFPANVLGMILMFILLCLKVVKLEQVGDVAAFLTSNMGFFFVPAAASVARDLGIVADTFWPILVICVVGTALVFGATAYTAYFIQRLQRKGNN
ncbi:MAG: CidA/LrgA family protein [Eubacteriaceae bacterium]|nr:CidA/LrgA family protein [Eubacteriaceae bacterium]